MGYAYKRSLTIASAQCGTADSAGFTVLVSLTDTTLKTSDHAGGRVRNASGFDIVFTSDSAGTTLLNWEVESYDNVNGVLVAWVKIASISHTVDTVFYMFYSNVAISTFQGGATGTAWDADYLGIYHLNGAGPSVASSTGANNGTNHGVTADTGQIDGCGALASASSRYVDLGNGMNPAAITWGCWVKPNVPSATEQAILDRNATNNTIYCLIEIGDGTAPHDGKLVVFVKTSGGLVAYAANGTYTLSNGTWYHVMVTYNSVAGMVSYVNGAVDKTVAANGTLTTTAESFFIGRNPNTATPRFFNGDIDEVRISQIARTANWILTEYNNQNAPGTFITLGTETRLTKTLAQVGDSMFGF